MKNVTYVNCGITYNETLEVDDNTNIDLKEIKDIAKAILGDDDLLLRIEGTDIYYIIDVDNNKIILRKYINNRLYTIVKDMPEDVIKLHKLLKIIIKLDNMFWIPLD